MPDFEWAPPHGAAALSHLGVIRAHGPDAAAFLHGQLTQDMAHLGDGEAAFAAWLSPKGRALASFVVLRDAGDEWRLVCHRSVLAATLRRLSMFVLRARVALGDATPDSRLVGLIGDGARALLPAGAAPWARRDAGGASAVRLYPADGQPRALWLAPRDVPAPGAAPIDQAAWLVSEVRAGVAGVSQAIADAFVPQMLNYESVGGVHFHKGCYPGQEIVARSQFRGTVKRRTFLAHTAAAVQAGDEVHAADGAGGEPVGSVAQAAALPGGGSAALVVLQTAAAARALRAGGAPLILEALPYALLQDI